MVKLIIQILYLLSFVQKNYYKLQIEIKKENLVRKSIKKEQKKRKNQGKSSLAKI